MKLINVTNNHRRMVKNQLDNTDAQLVQVYSAGNTTVIYEEAPAHAEILILNLKRNIRQDEIDTIREYFLKRLKRKYNETHTLEQITMDGMVEITILRQANLQT